MSWSNPYSHLQGVTSPYLVVDTPSPPPPPLPHPSSPSSSFNPYHHHRPHFLFPNDTGTTLYPHYPYYPTDLPILPPPHNSDSNHNNNGNDNGNPFFPSPHQPPHQQDPGGGGGGGGGGSPDLASEPHLLYWYYINGLGGSAIAIFGLLGNSVSICVLTHRSMRNSTSVLLIFMAVFDNVFLLLNLLLQTFPFIFAKHDICPEYIHVRQFLFKGFYSVVHMAHTGTIYMTMLVTVERAMVVKRPLRAKYICTRRRAVLVSLGVLLWSIIYNIPRCLEYGVQRVIMQNDSDANSTIKEFISEKTDFAYTTFYNVYYLVYFNSVFHFIFPFLVICVLNAMIVARLVKRRRHVPRNQRRTLQVESETKLTVMILSLTAVFCICHVFAAVELIIVQLEKDYTARLGHCSQACEGFSAFAETMTIVNSAINFLLYSMFGEKFRRVCFRYVCLFLKKPPPGASLQRTSHSMLTSSSYRGETFQLRLTNSSEK